MKCGISLVAFVITGVPQAMDSENFVGNPAVFGRFLSLKNIE
jgi:hypothetical protein